MSILHELLHRPLVNLLVFLYENVTFHDFGLAIVALTLIIRLILFPLSHKTAQHQKIMQKMQPRIKELQERHKDNREAQTKAILELYKEHKISPFGPIPLLVVQGFILFALFNVFREGFSDKAFQDLYPFITRPEVITTTFLGMVSLGLPNAVLVVLSAIAQFFQSKLSLPRTTGTLSPQERMAKNMVFILPAITLLILWNLPAAIGLYWLTSTLFSIGQQAIVDRRMDADAERLGSAASNTLK